MTDHRMTERQPQKIGCLSDGGRTEYMVEFKKRSWIERESSSLL